MDLNWDFRPSADGDAELPPSGWFPKWIVGLIVPPLLVAYGAICVATKHAVLVGDCGSIELHGTPGIALGVCIISVGLFLHCHFFWGNTRRMPAWAVLGKFSSLVACVVSLVYVAVRAGIWGR